MASLCQLCAKPARSRCGGCTEGLTVEGEMCMTSYCSPACQKEDWPTHKIECKSKNLRKQLHRAADVLQRAFYVVARATWDYSEVRAERGSDGHLRMHIKSEPVHKFVGYPNLGLTGLDEKAVLAHGNAMAQVTKMAAMVQQAFKGMGTESTVAEAPLILVLGTVAKYEVVVVVLKPEPLIDWLPLECKPPGHYVYRARLADKSVWALDLAGAVYDNTQSLMPWTSFASQYIKSTLRTMEAGYMNWAVNAEQLNVRARLMGGQPADCWAKNNILAQVGTELSDNALAASISDEHGYENLAELLKLPAVKFERAQQQFLERLTMNFAQHINAFDKEGGVHSKLSALVAGAWP
ncbi:hypothetical protein B0A48_05427 [Cryoendolithus antarcticus]|uniref:MYND-type domain-containing protein n=1 Tax=Cryoendolithus antarcticus TaxID=1507870 RepID=A0A1V8TIW1_9PEZI|nr:hypothetical protein B0A48_05427 [Cryoendolithus antarcticus]